MINTIFYTILEVGDIALDTALEIFDVISDGAADIVDAIKSTVEFLQEE